jgi:hypothetical protein
MDIATYVGLAPKRLSNKTYALIYYLITNLCKEKRDLKLSFIMPEILFQGDSPLDRAAKYPYLVKGEGPQEGAL